MESFKAAVNAGADAVYLGGDRFNARAYASNFSSKELLEALDIAHMSGRKIYLTLNTLFKDEELTEIYDYIYPLYENGLDGVIVQDIGVARLLHECFPELALHASTQMSITGSDGIRFLEELSFKRVVPARELSLKELEKMHSETGMELECFIHGALCYSYSGKCLFSSLLGGRSGNRGRCAGPCRLPYSCRYQNPELNKLYSEKPKSSVLKTFPAIMDLQSRSYPLSAKDICAVDIMDKLIEAGIYSFKIEGRMKSAEYVAGVTGIYRKYIDIVLSGELSGHPGDPEGNSQTKHYRVSKNDRDNLIGLYTRSGNSNGYYFEKNGPDMLSIDSPSYESADEKKKKSLYIKYAGNAPETELEAFVLIEEGAEARLVLCEAGACRDNDACEAGSGKNHKEEPKQSGSGEPGKRFVSVTVYGDKAESAKSRPLSYELVERQLEKCGGSGFNIVRKEIVIKGSPFLSAASLNDLRRKGLNAVRAEILKAHRREVSPEPHKAEELIRSHENRASGSVSSPGLHVRLLGTDALETVLDTPGVSVVTVPLSLFYDEAGLKKTYEIIKKRGISFCPALPYIHREDTLRNLPVSAGSLGKYCDAVLVDNYEALYSLLDTGFDKMIIEDIHLYDMNRIAEKVLKRTEDIVTCVPVELNKKELIRRGIKGEEFIVYGRLPMMLSAQCVQKTLSGCLAGDRAADEGRPDRPLKDPSENVIYLKDRLGNDFPCFNFCRECSNVIYNSVPLYITHEDGIIERLEPRYLRLDFTTESAGEIADIISYYRDLTGLLAGRIPDEKAEWADNADKADKADNAAGAGTVYNSEYYVNNNDPDNRNGRNNAIPSTKKLKLPSVEKYTKGHLNRGVQ
ncbi:MAG: U32 family peptidase [Lachnospiraceae bacterium]|nr:U32 family peptidase [Lachnospiraceae bacterium]